MRVTTNAGQAFDARLMPGTDGKVHGVYADGAYGIRVGSVVSVDDGFRAYVRKPVELGLAGDAAVGDVLEGFEDAVRLVADLGHAAHWREVEWS